MTRQRPSAVTVLLASCLAADFLFALFLIAGSIR
jgi:hypothetical protein